MLVFGIFLLKKVIVKSPGGCSLPACDPTKQVCEESELGKIVMNKYKRLVVEKKNKIADLGNKLVIEQGKF